MILRTTVSSDIKNPATCIFSSKSWKLGYWKSLPLKQINTIQKNTLKMLENWKLVYIRSPGNQEINKELENTSPFAHLTNIWRLTHEFWVVGLAFFFISRLAQL